MPEHRFIYAVFFEQLRKQRIFPLYVKWRIMNQRDQLVSLAAHLFHLLKRKAKAFRLAQIQRFVVLGKIVAAGARPPSGTRNNQIADFYAIVLQKHKTVVGAQRAHAGNPIPPIIVIAADQNFMPF